MVVQMKPLFTLALAVLLVLTIPGAIGEQESQISIEYENNWSGTIGADGNSRSIDGSGNATYEIEGKNIAATIFKLDNGSDPLTVRLIHKGSVIEEQTTTVGNGVVRVSHTISERSPSNEEDGAGAVCCLMILIVLILLLLMVVKRRNHITFRLPWVLKPRQHVQPLPFSKKPIGHPRHPPPRQPPIQKEPNNRQ